MKVCASHNYSPLTNDKFYDRILTSTWASIGIFSITTFLSVIHLISGGRVIIASTDILLFWEPLLEIFHSNIRNGELGYWNPFIAGGTGNYFNTYYTPFSPEFLLVALFSKKFVYHVLTFTYVGHLFLIGFLSHRILLREVSDAVWATTGAFVAQLSLPIAVALTSPAAIYNVTYFLMALYVVWSFEKRHPVLSLLYLTLAIVLCGLTGNLVIGSWAGVVFVILTVYRILTMPIYSSGFSRRLYGVLAGSAIVVSFFTTAIHWLPLVISISDSTRLGNIMAFSKELNTGPSVVRLFTPEWLGVHYSPSFDYFVSLGRNSGHIQAYAPVSYGVTVAIIVFFGLSLKRTRPSLFWGALTVVLICIAARIDPVFSLYALLFNPIIHPFGVEFFTPIVVGALVGHVGMNLSEVREGNYEWKLFGLLGLVLLLVGYIIFSWTAIIYHVQSPLKLSLIMEGARWVFIILLLVFGTLAYYFIFKNKILIKIYSYGILALGVTTFIVTVIVANFGESVTDFYFESGVLVSFRIFIYSVLPILLLFVGRSDEREGRRHVLWFAVFLVCCITFFSYGYQRPDGVLYPEVGATGDLTIAVLDLLGLLIAFMSCVLLLKTIAVKQAYNSLWKIVLALVIAAELIVTFHVHDRMVMYPSHSPEQLDARPDFNLQTADFRDQDGKEVDTVNFRIGRPMDVVRTIKGGIWSSMSNHWEANAPATLGISTYSGIPHVVDKKIRALYGVFGLKLAVGGIPAHLEDPRFLDLLSVGYIFDNGQFIRRDSRIGRFQLYSAWRTVSKPEVALETLKSTDFDPQRELVIMDNQPSLGDVKRGESKLVPIKSATSDHIELEVESSDSALLLFNDNYSRWWRAKVNGIPVKIMKANFSRMALIVSKGHSMIELELRPIFLYQAVICMVIGVVIFLAVAGWLFRKTGSWQYEALMTKGG